MTTRSKRLKKHERVVESTRIGYDVDEDGDVTIYLKDSHGCYLSIDLYRDGKWEWFFCGEQRQTERGNWVLTKLNGLVEHLHSWLEYRRVCK